MHFCQDEMMVIVMAFQNGFVGSLNFVLASIRSIFRLNDDSWLPKDIRRWRQANMDQHTMIWDKDKKRWVEEKKP